MSISMSARIGALIIQSAAASGADPVAIEAETGFAAATALDPDARMPLTTETALWAAGERLSGDRELGLHTAERLQPGVFDVLDYVVRTAPTLRIAVQRLARYNRLEHDVAEFSLQGEGERVRIVHAFRGGRPGQSLGQHRHSIEFTVASLAIIGRQLSGGPFAPTAVSFCHPAPENVDAHARVFGVLPRFSAPANVFEVAAADLDRPLPAADARLWRVIERHAEALLAARPDPAESLAARVARDVTNTLGEGPPALAGRRAAAPHVRTQPAAPPAGRGRALRGPGRGPATRPGTQLPLGPQDGHRRGRVPAGVLGAERVSPRVQTLDGHDARRMPPLTPCGATV
jgi:hypothetical protein